MRESTYFILAALQDGPLHGYAILQRISELSTGQVSLATGTLYTALERLTTAGHIHIVDEQIVNGRARRSYELTSAGGAALKEQADRLASAARVVTERRVTRAAVRPA
jgi:PadR family transcriptional regulator